MTYGKVVGKGVPSSPRQSSDMRGRKVTLIWTCVNFSVALDGPNKIADDVPASVSRD